MESRVIPEPQKTYVLELLQALGPAADKFVVAGAQAMKFMVDRARATKDIDFVLDVVKLRSEPLSLSAQLEKLRYTVVERSRNFQFEKPIPNSREAMRIEFVAPEELKTWRDGLPCGCPERCSCARLYRRHHRGCRIGNPSARWQTA